MLSRVHIRWLPRIVLFVLLLTLSGMAQTAQAAKAYLDNDEIYSGEAVLLTLLADGEWTGSELDLQPLKADFQVLSVTDSTQLRFERGQLRTRTRWAIRLQPWHHGQFMIPSLSVGEEQTRSLSLTVKAQNVAELMAAKGIFIEAEVSPKQPYVQAQILYTVRVRHTGNVLEHDFIPAAPVPGLSLQALDEERNYRLQQAEKSFHVIEQRYALFSEKSGTIKLPPITFRAKLFDTNRQPGSRTLKRRVTIVTQPVSLHIKPRPHQFSSSHWLPSSQLQLKLEWLNQQVVRVGEPITLQLVLEANGLRGFQLPPLDWPDSAILQQAGLRSYAAAATTDTITTPDGFQLRHVQPVTLVPVRSGALQLPAWQLAWWDTSADTLRLAELPAQALQVEALPELGQDLVTVSDVQPERFLFKSDVLTLGSSFWPSLKFSLQPAFWPLLNLGLFSLWLATAWAWKRQQQPRLAGSDAYALPGQGFGRSQSRQTQPKLRQACLDNDPRRAEQALLHWAQLHWTNQPPASLGALARHWPQHRSALLELDRALYGRTRPIWDGHAFWQRVQVDLE